MISTRPLTVWIDDSHAIVRRGMAACLQQADCVVRGESAALSPEPAVGDRIADAHLAVRHAAAERRAQEAITISIVPLEHIQQIDPSSWPRCLGKRCQQGRVFWDGYPELSMNLGPVSNPTSTSKQMTWVHYVGKCDRCGRFHVHCLTCRDLLSFDDNRGEHQCACKLPWFWLASIERDDRGEVSAELHLVMGPGNVVTVDRRPIAKR